MKRIQMPQPESSRSGSTLTEVLVSVMVLGIGLISVATLFPLAVMRGVRANQVTQSTILRYGAESQLRALALDDYWLFSVERLTISDPALLVGDPTTVNDHFPGGIGNDDADSVANLAGRDADGWNPGIDGRYGFGGNTTPGFSDATNVSDDKPLIDGGEVGYGNFDTPFIIVDPLGWWEMSDSRDVFASRTPTLTPPGTDTGSRIPRLNGGHRGNNRYAAANPRVRPTFVGTDPGTGTFFAFPAANTASYPPPVVNNFNVGGFGFDLNTARRIATLQDQFSTILDVNQTDIADPTTIPSRDEIDLPTSLPVNVLTDIIGTIAGGGTVKATFFGIIEDDLSDTIPPIRTILSRDLLHEYDKDGDGSFPPTDPDDDIDSDGNLDEMFPTARTIKWRSDEPLPANFQVERIVLQTLLEDFTWMATMQLPSRPPTKPQMDVIVFFKRRFETVDEFPYTCTRTVSGNGQRYTVDYSGGLPKPWASKGGYMFDLEHGVWYRITNIDDPDDGISLTVTLERDVRDRRDDPADNLDQVRACFMRGIVDVFPLEQ